MVMKFAIFALIFGFFAMVLFQYYLSLIHI